MRCEVKIEGDTARSIHLWGDILLDLVDFKNIKERGGSLGINRGYEGYLTATVSFPHATREQRQEAGRWCQRISYLGRYLLDAPHPKVFVDHIDGNSLDNRRSNIRLATPKQNAQNRKNYKDTESGFKGVLKYGGGWQVRIKIDAANVVIAKRIPDIKMAAMIYDLAAIEHFGEFANLNFPKEEVEAFRPHWDQIKSLFK
jgi:hypothetical protein